MSQIADGVIVGSLLNLVAFGPAIVTKIYVHTDTRETCCDCKSFAGDRLHLSMKYVQQVLARPAV
jgi:hypothetical protein